MAALTLTSEPPVQDADAPTDPNDGRPILGIALGLLLSVPLWAGLWCASAWI